MKNPELKVDDRVIILDMSDAQAVEPGTWGYGYQCYHNVWPSSIWG